MKRLSVISFVIILCCLTFLTSCQAIASIFGAGFKTGIWVAIIIVVGIIVLALKGFGSKKN